jgi:hypothetical protein
MPAAKPSRAPRAKPVREAILVLGMHRSGTSALTRILEILGARTPKNQIGAGVQNPKGFFEATSVARFNDRLLARQGLTWDCLTGCPAAPGTVAQEIFDEALGILEEEFGDAPLIALKDPRICRLAPFWTQVLQHRGGAPLVLITLRNPLEVAQSLQRRNKFELSQGLLLWLIYVLQAEAETRGLRRAFAHFDQILSDPAQAVDKICRVLRPPFSQGFQSARGEIEAFLSPELRHHQQADIATLPEMIQTVYAILTGWAATGEAAKDHVNLDRINQRFQALLKHEMTSQTLYQAVSFMNQTPANAPLVEGAGAEALVPSSLYNALFGAQEVLKSEVQAALREQALQEARQESLTRKLTGETKRASRLAQSLATAETRLSAAQSTCEVLTQDLARLTQVYLEADVRATTLRAALEKRDALGSSLMSQLAEVTAKYQNLGQIRDHISEENTELHALVAKVETKRACLAGENAELHALVARVETERARLSAENAELHALVARVELARQALVRSTTWRATEPLRNFISIFRRRG